MGREGNAIARDGTTSAGVRRDASIRLRGVRAGKAILQGQRRGRETGARRIVRRGDGVLGKQPQNRAVEVPRGRGVTVRRGGDNLQSRRSAVRL
eukprot:14152822-Heterocapsa_arctica.AAC.1